LKKNKAGCGIKRRNIPKTVLQRVVDCRRRNIGEKKLSLRTEGRKELKKTSREDRVGGYSISAARGGKMVRTLKLKYPMREKGSEKGGGLASFISPGRGGLGKQPWSSKKKGPFS